MQLLKKKLKDKSSEGYILTAIKFALLAAALLFIVLVANIGVRAVYMDVAADQIRDAVAASSSTSGEDTEDAIARWQDTFSFQVSIDANEWEDSSSGKLAYKTTFSVTLSYSDNLLFGAIPVNVTKYGVARHNWGTAS